MMDLHTYSVIDFYHQVDVNNLAIAHQVIFLRKRTNRFMSEVLQVRGRI